MAPPRPSAGPASSGHQTCTHQGGLATPRGAQHEREPRPTELLEAVEQSLPLPDLLVTSEKDGGVLFLKRRQAWIWRPSVIPIKQVFRVQSRSEEPLLQTLVSRIPSGCGIDDLSTGEDAIDLRIIDFDRKHWLAQRLGMGDLGKAPTRRHRRVATEDNHRSAFT